MERKGMKEEKVSRAREDGEVEPISECIYSVSSVENGHQVVVFSLRVLSRLWPAFVVFDCKWSLHFQRLQKECNII